MSGRDPDGRDPGATMLAVRIVNHDGPDRALSLDRIAIPGPAHPFTGREGVSIDVRAAGVSFPEVLQTRGLYQISPDLPFVPGSEVAGTVRSAPPGSGFAPGDPVLAFCQIGGFAQVAVAQPHLVFPLPAGFDWAEGAGFALNYHTAYFSLVTRGRLAGGETVVVHGASGGVGTAALQVAKAFGCTTVAVVSTEAKAEVARRAGATHVVRAGAGDDWKGAAAELIGRADLVLDPVGGDRFTDSLRLLRPMGRLVVVGFAAGEIPVVKANRLLLGNTEVIGAGYGAYLDVDESIAETTARSLDRFVEEGHLRPLIEARFPLERAAEALHAIADRAVVGKAVFEIDSPASAPAGNGDA